MFPNLAARETHFAETNFAARKQENVFASGQRISKSYSHLLILIMTRITILALLQHLYIEALIYPILKQGEIKELNMFKPLLNPMATLQTSLPKLQRISVSHHQSLHLKNLSNFKRRSAHMRLMLPR